MSSCFFVGHREATQRLLPRLIAVVEWHIKEYGVTEFIVGNYGKFDRMAAHAVICAKEKYPHIMLSMLLPYHPAERPVKMDAGFDSSFYPPGKENVPRRFAIPRANRYMVTHVDYIIAYVWHTASNAKELVEYAQCKGVKITNLEKME